MNKILSIKPLFMPKNESELFEIERHVQSILKEQISINITSKKANKLRDLTCNLVGFQGGFQQLKTHWNNDIIKTECTPLLLEILTKAIKNGSMFLNITEKTDCSYVYMSKNRKNQLERIINIKETKLVLKNISNLCHFEKNKNKDSFTMFFNNQRYDFKISIIDLINNEKDIIIKIKNKSKKISIDDIGITDVKRLKSVLSLKKGLILIGGTTGSGKKTTSAAIIDYCSEYIGNTKKQNPNYNPNLIHIKEIKNKEDLLLVREHVENGYLVISEIHSNSNEGSERRLELLSETNEKLKILKCLIYQKIIYKKCSFCQSIGCINCQLTGRGVKTLISSVYLKNEEYKNMLFQDCLEKYKNKEISLVEMNEHFNYIE